MIPTQYAPVVTALHVTANLVWIGALVAASSLNARARWMADPAETGRLALGLHRRWALPAMIASFVTGIAALLNAPHEHLRSMGFVTKLALVVLVVVAHRAIGKKARGLELGEENAGKRSKLATAALILCTLGIACATAYSERLGDTPLVSALVR
jgi:uncharacterized membrane protein